MSNICYHIVDEKGNHVDGYSFLQVAKDTWLYFSNTGYPEGSVLYPTPDHKGILELRDYLIHMSKKLGLSKHFFIVPLDADNLDFNGRKIVDEVKVEI